MYLWFREVCLLFFAIRVKDVEKLSSIDCCLLFLAYSVIDYDCAFEVGDLNALTRFIVVFFILFTDLIEFFKILFDPFLFCGAIFLLFGVFKFRIISFNELAFVKFSY